MTFGKCLLNFTFHTRRALRKNHKDSLHHIGLKTNQEGLLLSVAPMKIFLDYKKTLETKKELSINQFC